MAETRVVNKQVRRNDSSFTNEEELIAKSEVEFLHQRGLQAVKKLKKVQHKKFTIWTFKQGLCL